MNEGRAICAICGQMAHEGYVVAMAMAALDERLWTGKGESGKVRYASLNRCADRVACRARLERGGSKWPLIEAEGIGRRTPPSLSQTNEPLAPSDVVAEEADPWAAF